MIYEEYEDNAGGKAIKRTDKDGKVSYIPYEPANSDYQRYLRWLENPDADETQGGIN